MKKKDKQYLDKYGDIPKYIRDRLRYILDNMKIRDKDLLSIITRSNRISNSVWKEVYFTFYILPEGTPRPRMGRGGRFYVKGAKDDTTFFKNYIETCDEEYELIITPCQFDCKVYMPIPSTMNKVESILSEVGLIRPISIPDWDNIGKKYCDMVQSTLLLNDSLVVDGRVRKYYSFKPRVEIRISYLEDFNSSYNKKKVDGWKK